MTLFTPDLFRNFAIGFLAAALVLVLTTSDNAGTIVSEAQASEKVESVNADIDLSDDFLILQANEEAPE